MTNTSVAPRPPARQNPVLSRYTPELAAIAQAEGRTA